MSRVLLVLMNKDNCDGLRRALETLEKQEGCNICECFDVVVMDGHSTDESEKVAEEFRKRYPCIRFIKQKIKGGVGPARAEVIRYAMDHGYDYILWGDSENIYRSDYVSSILSCLSRTCDVVSGFSLVRHSSVWSRMFYWYHAYHLLFKYVRERHAPGNNKLVATRVYKEVMYPPSSRSDDFYFSVLALKKGLKFCYCPEAVVEVSMPETFNEVKKWQRSRVKGLVEGAYMIGKRTPPDLAPWAVFAFSPIIPIISLYEALQAHEFMLKAISLFLLAGYLLILGYLGVKLELLAHRAYKAPKPLQGILGLLGMYLHSLFTTFYGLKFMLTMRKRKEQLKQRVKEVLSSFGFNEELARLR